MALMYLNYPNDCLCMSHHHVPRLVKTRQWYCRTITKFPANLYKPTGPLIKPLGIIHLPKEKVFCFGLVFAPSVFVLAFFCVYGTDY